MLETPLTKPSRRTRTGVGCAPGDTHAMNRLSRIPNRILIAVLGALMVLLGAQVGWVAHAEQESVPLTAPAPTKALPHEPAVSDLTGSASPHSDTDVPIRAAVSDRWSAQVSSYSKQQQSQRSPREASEPPLSSRASEQRPSPAPRSTERAEGAASINRNSAGVEPAQVKKCRNPLVRILHDVGFRGENVREAWAIAMRESRGQVRLGPGHPQYNGSDVGLFQWNRPTWGGAPWWDEQKLLDGHYNASIVFKMSKGGHTWTPWGLTGQGQLDASHYASIWSDWQIQSWIWEPYSRFYQEFADLPAACQALAVK